MGVETKKVCHRDHVPHSKLISKSQKPDQSRKVKRMGEVFSACFERNRHDKVKPKSRPNRKSSFESLDDSNLNPTEQRLSQRESRARMISQHQANKGVRNLVIKEDTVLEALCERTNIEPRTTSVKNREISVTKKERRKLFNRFASSTDMEDLFRDENKMKAFIITQTGYSERDNEINEEIEQLSKRLCSQRSSVTTNGGAGGGGGGGRSSRTSRTSLNSRNSNQSITLLGQRMSRTSFNSVMKILNEHREKVKSGEHVVQAAENMQQQQQQQRNNRANRKEVRQSNIIEEMTFEDSKVNNENWRNS